MLKFDYYIFIDYSENLIGYLILNGKNLDNILPFCGKLKHYSSLRYKNEYIKSIKKYFDCNDIFCFFECLKIVELRNNLEIYSDILEFIDKKGDFKFFISVDDRQYKNFEKLVSVVDCKNYVIIREGKLKKNSIEYKMSLLIDTLLNIERKRNK